MGSLLARSLAINYINSADAFIFSATSDHPGLKGYIGKPLACLCSFLFGKRKKSKLLEFLTNGDFNKKIKNNKTKKDWLSRNNSVVEKYMNDPYCMQIFSNQFFADLAYGVIEVNKRKEIKKMNINTPLLILSGEMDPVGNYGKGIANIAERLRSEKIKNLTVKLFKGGRHEMLNETNKTEVYNYIYNWLLNF
jgi:alpha-beta hydrolase superfamily lysophospholipase